jgi:CheY-like chemotaxis protein
VKLHVLIVEDEIEVLRVNQELLELLDYKVTAAKDGLEALAIYRESPTSFDLVILDLGLPSMSGLEVLDEVLKTRADQKVVICSGDASYTPEDGGPPCLYKPFRFTQLKATIETLLLG